jgi:hypothetical protein
MPTVNRLPVNDLPVGTKVGQNGQVESVHPIVDVLTRFSPPGSPSRRFRVNIRPPRSRAT